MKIFLCEHAEKILVCSRNFLSFYNRRNPNIISTNIFQKIYWNFKRIFGLRKRFSAQRAASTGIFFENLAKLPDLLSWLGPYPISTFNCLRHQRMILRQTQSGLLIKKKTHIVPLKTMVDKTYHQPTMLELIYLEFQKFGCQLFQLEVANHSISAI